MISLLLLAMLAADVPPLPEPERAIVRTAEGEWRIERDIEAEPADDLVYLTSARPDEALGSEEADEASADLRDAFEEAIDMARHPD